jgi:hypothetical protein
MKRFLLTLLSVALTSAAALAYENEKKNYPYVNQLGLAIEERNNYANAYLYFNQIVYDNLYWEVRGNYFRNFIVTGSPKIPGNLPSGPIISALTNTPVTAPNPVPTPADQDNLDGVGIVGKLGWVFHPSDKVTFRPYLRFNWYKNNSTPYKDDFGNKIESDIKAYLLGAKLIMNVNNIFDIYVDYYAGIQEVNFKVAGYYTIVPSDLEIEELTSTFEIGADYKLNKCWTFIPFIQLVITANDPSFNAFWGPIQNSGLTTFTPVFGSKIAYRWPT